MSGALSLMYMFEALGAKSYLCPEPVYSLRSLKGALPCRVLAAALKALTPSQADLLKKIMASIDVFEYSLLEIKDERILSRLLKGAADVADFIMFFGAKGFLKDGFLGDGALFLPASGGKGAVFGQFCALEELEGPPAESARAKRQLWEELKKWKALSKISA